MQAIDDYSLQPRMLKGEQSERSRLLFNDVDTGNLVLGVSLFAQYRCAAGVLLICDFDCPYEESLVFQLLDSKGKLLAKAFLLDGRSNNLLYRVWVDGDTLVLHTYDHQFFRLIVSKRTIWWRWLGPWRIVVAPIASTDFDAAMIESIAALNANLAGIRMAMVK
jgi:hypothetical protein